MDPSINIYLYKSLDKEYSISDLRHYNEGTEKKKGKEKKYDIELKSEEISAPVKFSIMPRNIIGMCNFKTPEALIACNIDALFNYTQQNGGYLLDHVLKERQDYAMFGDDTFGFAEYVHWRRLDSYILAFTKEIPEHYDNSRYVHVGRDNVVVEEIKNNIPDGLDVVIVSSREKTAGEDILYSLDIIEKHMKQNIVFIGKIFFNEESKKILRAMTLIFKESYIVKPISCNPYTNVFYYIGIGLNDKVENPELDYSEKFNKWIFDSFNDIKEYRKIFTDVINSKVNAGMNGSYNEPAFNRLGVIFSWCISDEYNKKYY